MSSPLHLLAEGCGPGGGRLGGVVMAVEGSIQETVGAGYSADKLAWEELEKEVELFF